MTNLSMSKLREAADNFASDGLKFAKYGEDINEYVKDIVTDTLERMAGEIESAPADSDEIEDIIRDFCESIAGSLEDMRDNGLASEISESDAIYTTDIFDFYAENMNLVDDAIYSSYGDLSEFNTISDAMAFGVTLALENIAEDEINEIIEAFENWAKDEIINHIFG